MALAGFGPDPIPVLSDAELRAGALKAARTILAGHAGCGCDLCDLAHSVELNLEGVTYER